MLGEKKYKVTDKKGLTVTSKVFPEGQEFDSSQWKWSEASLEAAIKKGRCKMIDDGKKKEAEKEAEKKPLSKKQINALETELEMLMKKYGELEDQESEDAKNIEKRIKEIEKELKL